MATSANQAAGTNGGTPPPNALLDAGLNAAGDEDADVSVTIDPPEGDETPPADGKDAEREAVQVEARGSGWVSKEAWVEKHGNDKGWRDADQWVDYRRNALPIVQAENKELKTRLAALEQKDMDRDRQQAEREVEYQRQSLRAELRAARESENWDKVDEISEKLFDLKLKTPAAPASGRGADPATTAAFNAFKDRNSSWFVPGSETAQQFGVEMRAVCEANPQLSIADALERAKDRFRRLYPEHFPARGRAPLVEGGGEHGASVNGTRSWSQLKPDYREQYERMAEGMQPKALESFKKQVLSTATKDVFK